MTPERLQELKTASRFPTKSVMQEVLDALEEERKARQAAEAKIESQEDLKQQLLITEEVQRMYWDAPRQVQKLQAEIILLREALQPFARFAELFRNTPFRFPIGEKGNHLTREDLERAAKALQPAMETTE